MRNILLSVHPIMWAFMIITSAIFMLVPQIDLYISDFFYTKQEHFFLNGSYFEQFFYNSVKPLLISMFLGSIFLWLYNRFSKKMILNFGGKQLLYIILVAGIGSGLIVNDILKEHWGRARPAEIKQFGGSKTFTPAFIISDQDGYSFSCGHGSGAFILIAVALLFHKYRGRVMFVVLSYGALVSLARIVGGGHFFSDTVVSFFIMWIVSNMLYYMMFERENRQKIAT